MRSIPILFAFTQENIGTFDRKGIFKKILNQ